HACFRRLSSYSCSVALMVLAIGDDHNRFAYLLITRERAHSQADGISYRRALYWDEFGVDCVEEYFCRLCVGGERHLDIRFTREPDQRYLTGPAHTSPPRQLRRGTGQPVG